MAELQFVSFRTRIDCATWDKFAEFLWVQLQQNSQVTKHLNKGVLTRCSSVAAQQWSNWMNEPQDVRHTLSHKTQLAKKKTKPVDESNEDTDQESEGEMENEQEEQHQETLHVSVNKMKRIVALHNKHNPRQKITWPVPLKQMAKWAQLNAEPYEVFCILVRDQCGRKKFDNYLEAAADYWKTVSRKSKSSKKQIVEEPLGEPLSEEEKSQPNEEEQEHDIDQEQPGQPLDQEQEQEQEMEDKVLQEQSEDEEDSEPQQENQMEDEVLQEQSEHEENPEPQQEPQLEDEVLQHQSEEEYEEKMLVDPEQDNLEEDVEEEEAEQKVEEDVRINPEQEPSPKRLCVSSSSRSPTINQEVVSVSQQSPSSIVVPAANVTSSVVSFVPKRKQRVESLETSNRNKLVNKFKCLFHADGTFNFKQSLPVDVTTADGKEFWVFAPFNHPDLESVMLHAITGLVVTKKSILDNAPKVVGTLVDKDTYVPMEKKDLRELMSLRVWLEKCKLTWNSVRVADERSTRIPKNLIHLKQTRIENPYDINIGKTSVVLQNSDHEDEDSQQQDEVNIGSFAHENDVVWDAQYTSSFVDEALINNPEDFNLFEDEEE